MDVERSKVSMKLQTWKGRLGSLTWTKWNGAIVTLLVIALLISVAPQDAEAAGSPTLEVGSRQPDVWDLQYRLDTLGYPTDVDGIFGLNTRKSVISFQRNFGLMQDGVVGPDTWKALKRRSFTKADVDLLTRLVYSEARGESYKGQVAVAGVVLNRIHSSKFPDTVRGVIFQKGAFTAVDDGQFWLQPNRTARKAALDAIRGWDPSRNALFYFNPDVATSKWIWSRPQLVTIGKHIFAA
jgi:N-acetylmuramoyl-L-alanine amidase